MTKLNKSIPFDVVNQELSGNNTIEASAGTGKTYSLAILVVRLLIEQQIPIEKILLVTFTEAAAAELKERAVKFIRLALRETEIKGSSEDATIEKIIAKSKLKKAEIKHLLNRALLDFDKATMSTIHSFCQQTLNEFAFETGQVFGKELMTDISEIVELELNEYWRNHITPTDYNFWQYLGIASRSIWKSALENTLRGQQLLPPFEAISALQDLVDKIDSNKEAIIRSFDDNIDDLREVVRSHNAKGFRKNSALEKLENGLTFYNYLSHSCAFSFDILFPLEIEQIRSNEENNFLLKKQVAHFHLHRATELILPKIKERLNDKNALTFDDLIQKLYEKRTDVRLQLSLREKYQAVFVDEFQDTDPKQYAIFKAFFQDNESTILFFIGDPKQSIYGWRQADLETYRAARDSANMRRLTMNTNFRSSQSFVTAANEFFNADVDSKLSYIDVEAFENNNVGLAWSNNQKAFSSIHVQTEFPNEDLVQERIQSSLKLLFSGELILNGAAIRPSNVAILVRTGRQGKAVKNTLQKLKIPSVILQEESIFASEEALELKELLNAVLNISKSNIDRLLLTTLIGKQITELYQVNTDLVVPFFYALKGLWQKEGVFVMAAKFVKEFDLINQWKDDVTSGHQKLSNWQQLVDILQEKTLQESLTPLELYQFLSRKIQELPTGEYEQGIESDENAVKIMTIHKSKGLEFDIVLLPFLSMENTEKTGQIYTFTSFRKKVKGKRKNTYYFSLKGLKGTDLVKHEKQNQEENERLLYVALTRAKYNVFLFAKTGTHLLTPYVNALTASPITTVKLQAFGETADWNSLLVKPPKPEIHKTLPKPFPLADFPDKNYHKISYSFLAGKHGKSEKENSTLYDDENYDRFVFKDLPKGAHIGNLLHAIFEFIDFTDATTWEQQIERSVQQFAPGLLTKPNFLESLKMLVEQTLTANIEVGGECIPLNSISRVKRVNELEFNFPVKNEIDFSALAHFFGDDSVRDLHVTGGNVMGMMTGFIDLLFEHNGKFYILDWKSNFLGDQLHHYDQSAVMNAMNENNYHLQYLIYALAVEKFLKSKQPTFDFEKQFGGVIYLFLRGTRSNENSGVFVQGVSAEEVGRLGEVLGGIINVNKY
jgi:exodeoxyribonuclease V beta subunit